jgi:hypothetical protein
MVLSITLTRYADGNYELLTRSDYYPSDDLDSQSSTQTLTLETNLGTFDDFSAVIAKIAALLEQKGRFVVEEPPP